MTRESKQAQALLRVFESLGVPLIGAVDELLAWQGAAADPSPEEAARRFAALLSASISTGSQFAARLAPATQEESENIRLRASSLVAAVIAPHYVLSGSLPDDAFNRRVTSAFDAILALADSFPLLPDDDASPTDMVAARVEALSPFVAAVMRFPFGLEDSTVIRRLGERLCDKASALADAFSNGLPNGPELYAVRELAFLKGGAKLLARACEIEMDRLQHLIAQNQMQQPPAPEVLVDHIWQRFENGIDVLRAVIGFVAEPNAQTQGTQTQDTGSAAPTPVAPKAAEAPQTPAPEKPQGIPGNPMSFFVKKDANSGEAA